MQLTKNFFLYEFTSSPTASRLGIPNDIRSGEVENNILRLCERVLQPCRDKFGPISIQSGYRSSRLNRAIGGARNSDHLYGRAADITVTPPRLMEALGAYIQDRLDYDQLIWEHGGQWIHVSYRSQHLNRLQTLEAYASNSWGRRKTRYRGFQFDQLDSIAGAGFQV